MIKKVKNIMDNVIDGLIKMGENTPTPRFLDLYVRSIQELPGYSNSNLLHDSLEKELSGCGADSKAAKLEGQSALPGNVVSDEALVAK